MARTDSPEVRIAAAVALTATLFSPRVRGMLRRGAVQGLAGVLTAGGAIASFARGVGRGLQESGAPPAGSRAEASAPAADVLAPDPVVAPAARTRGAAAPRRPRRPSKPKAATKTPSSDAASTTAPKSRRARE